MSLFKVWRVIDGRKPRFAGRLPILDDLFSKVTTIRSRFMYFFFTDTLNVFTPFFVWLSGADIAT